MIYVAAPGIHRNAFFGGVFLAVLVNVGLSINNELRPYFTAWENYGEFLLIGHWGLLAWPVLVGLQLLLSDGLTPGKLTRWPCWWLSCTISVSMLLACLAFVFPPGSVMVRVFAGCLLVTYPLALLIFPAALLAHHLRVPVDDAPPICPLWFAFAIIATYHSLSPLWLLTGRMMVPVPVKDARILDEQFLHNPETTAPASAELTPPSP